MNTQNKPKASFRPSLFKLEREARELLEQTRDAEKFLREAVARQLYSDALAFVAQWLPPRSAVWWGCLCAWHLLRPEPGPAARAALKAAIHWVMDPCEDNRRAAERAGYEADIDTPAGNLALAAYLSAGSMAPAGMPNVDAPEGIANTTVGNAIKLLLTPVPRAKLESVQQHLLDLALQVHTGKVPWMLPGEKCCTETITGIDTPPTQRQDELEPGYGRRRS